MIQRSPPIDLPVQARDIRQIGALEGSQFAYMLSQITQAAQSLTVAIVQDVHQADRLHDEIQFFQQNSPQSVPLLHFPDWETLPYDSFSPHQEIISERLATLNQLSELTKGLLIVPITTLMARLCPKTYIDKTSFLIKCGDHYSIETARRRLEAAGYHHVPKVMEHGEFSVRGSIIDIFPMGGLQPFRIDLFGDEIDSIRSFDIESQRSLIKLDEIRLLPAREYPLDKEGIGYFRTQWRMRFSGDPTQCPMYLDTSSGQPSAGAEYYLPLFFESTSHLLEYLPNDSLLVRVGDLESAASGYWTEINARYEQYGHNVNQPLLAPDIVFIPPDRNFQNFKNFPQVVLTSQALDTRAGRGNCGFEPLPQLHVDSSAERPLKALGAYVQGAERYCLVAETEGRSEVLREMLQKHGLRAEISGTFYEFQQSSHKLGLVVGALAQGFIEPQLQISFITENDLFGRRLVTRRRRKGHKAFEAEAIVRDLSELTLGAAVVHREHGVGRYQGLTRLCLNNVEQEFLTLIYANDDKLYVPVTSLHLIGRYGGADAEHAPLNRLGTDQWTKAKRKAREQAHDVAAELLSVQARRVHKKAHAFSQNDEHYEAFCAAFPFEETRDQQQAIAAVIRDLCSDKAMDRIICGDVGFGKTEVALRAAFLVVNNGKQAAVLVPTTLLAEQHFQTFSSRFASFPIKVEVLSRFRSQKEQAQVIAGLHGGQIDILIGTHKLLQGDVHFKDLGLMIIDEEHRFGVRDKERLKQFRAEVDILTLTATPIPRTLNMALSGVRDLSIIATPPSRRLSIKTFVREYNQALIQEAIQREIHRGGQVYFVHNDIESIEQVTEELQRLVPQARITSAHGQLRERNLEQIMSQFYHRRFNVLVCTTIIETGIDVPTANTIIINRADKFGLAQLHQLRGRVGRSHHQAYAFCLTPARKAMTSDAVKRLEALSAAETLGSGFALASQDLEIRGAGALLGDAQSGNIHSVGYQLYMEILEEAVRKLKSGEADPEPVSANKCEIDLQLPSLLPEAYVHDVNTRLSLYKLISECKDSAAIDDIKAELIDRFGRLPQQTVYLLEVTRLRITAQKLAIVKLDVGARGGQIELAPTPKISTLALIKLIQTDAHIYQLQGSKLRFSLDLAVPQSRIDFLTRLMQTLSPDDLAA